MTARMALTTQYFRQYDDGGPNGNYNPATLGLSWASFMTGLPTSASLSDNASYTVSNQFWAGFLQDTWRVTPRFTLTLSLRTEWENGAKGHQNDWISGWDPNAQLPISAAAQAAFASQTASQVPEISPSAFQVTGGALYAGTSGAPSRAWGSQLMWLPRAGFGYQINSKTVIRGGYGIYYDSLDVNALVYGLNQTGYSVSTNTTFTTNQGVTWGSNGACGTWCNAGTHVDLAAYGPVSRSSRQWQYPFERARWQRLRIDGPVGTNQRTERLDRSRFVAPAHAALAPRHRAATDQS